MTVRLSHPSPAHNIVGDDASAHALAQLERDIVSDGRPDETIGEMMISTMQTGICFNGPKLKSEKNERKILVVLGKKY